MLYTRLKYKSFVKFHNEIYVIQNRSLLKFLDEMYVIHNGYVRQLVAILSMGKHPSKLHSVM